MNKSIVIPVYNEEGNIGNLIDKINPFLNDNDELIVVNDGSSDNTESEIKSKKCSLISLKTNKGKSLTNFDIICKLESIKHQLIKIKSQI